MYSVNSRATRSGLFWPFRRRLARKEAEHAEDETFCVCLCLSYRTLTAFAPAVRTAHLPPALPPPWSGLDMPSKAHEADGPEEQGAATEVPPGRFSETDVQPVIQDRKEQHHEHHHADAFRGAGS